MARTQLIQVRVTPEEYDTAEFVAANMQRDTISDALRQLIREKANDIRVRQKLAELEAEKESA